MTLPALPEGLDSFEKVIRNGYYYVDKTMLIKDIVFPNPAEVTLITRPRRFGKSLNMSMLKSFFDIRNRENNSPDDFAGLKIKKETDICSRYQYSYPVVHLSFKDSISDFPNDPERAYSSAMMNLKDMIGIVAEEYMFLAESENLNENDKAAFQQLINRNTGSENAGAFIMVDGVLGLSLWTLTYLLKKHYKKPVIVLVDEYDVPLDRAYTGHYYDDFINIYRKLLSRGLKGNPNLAFAVLTGCLKLSKESIFTGLNNLKICSVLSPDFASFFGFDDQEVDRMLDVLELSHYRDQVKAFYDGYRIGGKEIYNPWSVLGFCSSAMSSLKQNLPVEFPSAWSGSSSNDIMRTLLQKSTYETRQDFMDLIFGNTITKTIRTQLTYHDLYASVDNIWTILLHTGYLTVEKRINASTFALRIPNNEVSQIYQESVLAWCQNKIRQDSEANRIVCDALENDDTKGFEDAFNQRIRKLVSIRDGAVKSPKENYYQAFLMATLGFRDSWHVSGNQESGDGYYDIAVENEESDWAAVFELKYAKEGNYEKALKEAKAQIFKRKYFEKFEQLGFSDIRLYAVACFGKKCLIQKVHAS